MHKVLQVHGHARPNFVLVSVVGRRCIRSKRVKEVTVSVSADKKKNGDERVVRVLVQPQEGKKRSQRLTETPFARHGSWAQS